MHCRGDDFLLRRVGFGFGFGFSLASAFLLSVLHALPLCGAAFAFGLSCDALFGLLVLLLASALCLACFKRRPCAGRHLLFFAAAKKSRQKKAAEHR